MLRSFIFSERKFYVTLLPSHIQSQHFFLTPSLGEHICTIHCPFPITLLHSHSYSASPRGILYYLRSFCSNNFLSSYIHPPTHYYTTSFHILIHPSTSSNIIINSASQQNQSKHLLLQTAQLRYFGIKSASTFNLSTIICSLSEKFHTSIINHVFFLWKS